MNEQENNANVTIGDEQDVDLEINNTITINTDDWLNQFMSTPSLGNITISASTGNNYGTTISSGYNPSWTSANRYGPASAQLDLEGEDADVVINGKSLTKFMETMESRLAILTPDLEKLEHFAALKKAYDNYKMLEALCEMPAKEQDD